MRRIGTRSHRQYLLHIRDAIAKIEQYAAVGRDDFFALPHWQDAIIRQLEVIGEASKRFSSQVREANPSVPWQRICGLRDVLIHNYMGVDLEEVWGIIEKRIPDLKQTVERILSELSDPTEVSYRPAAIRLCGAGSTTFSFFGSSICTANTLGHRNSPPEP